MGNAVVDNAYYDWLLDKIEYDDYCFDTILEILFNTPFTWSIANDDNRAMDGIVLRSIFMSEEGWNTEPYKNHECSVLEMMIALAMRIENDIMWDGEDDRTAQWFWEMIRNLKLDEDSLPGYIYGVLNRFLNRQYDENGHGGLFPLNKNAGCDQRNTEIWYQAQSYLMENYSF